MTKTVFLLAIPILLINCSVQDQKLTEAENIQIKTEVRASFDSLVESTKVQDWESYFNHFDQNNFSGLNADGTVWESFENLTSFPSSCLGETNGAPAPNKQSNPLTY